MKVQTYMTVPTRNELCRYAESYECNLTSATRHAMAMAGKCEAMEQLGDGLVYIPLLARRLCGPHQMPLKISELCQPELAAWGRPQTTVEVEEATWNRFQAFRRATGNDDSPEGQASAMGAAAFLLISAHNGELFSKGHGGTLERINFTETPKEN